MLVGDDGDLGQTEVRTLKGGHPECGARWSFASGALGKAKEREMTKFGKETKRRKKCSMRY